MKVEIVVPILHRSSWVVVHLQCYRRICSLNRNHTHLMMNRLPWKTEWTCQYAGSKSMIKFDVTRRCTFNIKIGWFFQTSSFLVTRRWSNAMCPRISVTKEKLFIWDSFHLLKFYEFISIVRIGDKVVTIETVRIQAWIVGRYDATTFAIACLSTLGFPMSFETWWERDIVICQYFYLT